jgi:DNA-binding response OmpR family regulator
VPGSILVIDDDPDIQLVIGVALEDAGFAVVPALTAEQGLLAAREQAVDLALLDLRLPGLHGLEALPSLRATSPIPILLITAQTAGPDIATALLKGADDYLTKPFSTRELVSRVRAHLAPLPWPECVQLEGLEVCPATGQVSVDGDLVPLTTAELRLLAHLVHAGGRVLGPNELLRDVWGHRSAGDLRIVASMVQRVRSKTGDVGIPHLLIYSPESGYQVRPEALVGPPSRGLPT